MGKGLGRRRLLIAAVIAAMVVPVALVITQQRAASAATILSILDGSASVARGTAAFAPASDGDIVNNGDRVQTAQNSHALVTFFDGSTLEIEPATTVQIEDAQVAASGAISIRIFQTVGRTWSSVQKLTRADSKFELRTPMLTAAVRGTAFITEVLADGTSSVQTVDGNVEVTAQGQSVLVGAGQTTTARPNSPPSAPSPSPAPQNRLRFGMHSPAYVAVVDPFGRACGVVLPGPTVVRQIPGCLASEPGTDPQLVDVPNASPGLYKIVIATTQSGGAFVLTASALDSFDALSFDYTASGNGGPEAKFASSIDVAVAPNGSLTASGLGPLTATDTSPVKLVLGSRTPKPTVSGSPDAALYPSPKVPPPTVPPLVSPAPLETLAVPTATPVVPTVAPTIIATAVPTPLPTLPPTPIPTLPPTPLPTLPPTPVPTLPPTLPPTPTPTPQPTPTPLPPTLSGGQASPGGTLPVLGTNWPVGAAIVIKWPDGTQIASADVQADGRFATVVRIPQSAVPGTTYKITATGGGLSATADVLIVVVYSPSLTLNNTAPPRAGASVPYSGSGWPPNTDYSILFAGQVIPGGGKTSTNGTIGGSFTVPVGTKAGTYTVTATTGVYSASASLTTQ